MALLRHRCDAAGSRACPPPGPPPGPRTGRGAHAKVAGQHADALHGGRSAGQVGRGVGGRVGRGRGGGTWARWQGLTRRRRPAVRRAALLFCWRAGHAAGTDLTAWPSRFRLLVLMTRPRARDACHEARTTRTDPHRTNPSRNLHRVRLAQGLAGLFGLEHALQRRRLGDGLHDCRPRGVGLLARARRLPFLARGLQGNEMRIKRGGGGVGGWRSGVVAAPGTGQAVCPLLPTPAHSCPPLPLYPQPPPTPAPHPPSSWPCGPPLRWCGRK